MRVLDGYVRKFDDTFRWVMRVIGKDGNPAVEETLMPFTPYFYVLSSAKFDGPGITNALKLPLDSVRVVLDGSRSCDGAELQRMEFDDPYQLNKVKKWMGAWKTFEADLPYARRVFIDTGLEIAMPRADRKAYFDIEVDTSKGSPDVKQADSRIISIAVVGSDGEEHVFCEDDEKELVRKFIRAVRKYWVVAGWFSNRFDMPYIDNRIKGTFPELFREEDWRPSDMMPVDLAAIYRDILLRPPPHSLEAVAQKELGAGKVDIKRSRMHEYFRDDREKLMEYNLNDARLCRRLDEKFPMVDMVFTMARMSHCPVQHMFKRWWFKPHESGKLREFIVSAPIDSLLLHLAGKRKPRLIMPSKTEGGGMEENVMFKGAHVFPTVPGVHEYVVSVDARAMYPSIIQTWNIGRETWREDDSGDLKALYGSFVSEPKSLLSEMLEIANAERMKYLRLRQQEKPDSAAWRTYDSVQWAWKTLRNAAYGVQGSIYSRYYKREVAENITQLGKELIILAADEAQGMGFELIGGDTDGIMLKVEDVSDERLLPEMADALAEVLTDVAAKHCREKYGVKDPRIVFEIDKIYRSVLFTKKEKEGRGVKKRYAGLVMWQDGAKTDYLHVKGFETIRFDYSAAARRFQRELLEKILRREPAVEIARFITGTRQRLLDGELDEELVVYKGLNKLGSYKVVPPHLRAARSLMKQGVPVQRGDKIGFIKYGPKPEQVVGIPPEEAPPIKLRPAQYDYIWNKSFKRIMQRLEAEEHIQEAISGYIQTRL